MAHGSDSPSSWVLRWAHLIPPGGTVLDVACGHGRHMRWLAQRGHPVTGIDRSPEAIAAVSPLGQAIQADIENGPWPLGEATFNAVVVTNYLWRPLFARLIACVAPGGVLIYETFAEGNESVGKPSRPDFLLRPGELLHVTAARLQTIAFEQGFCDHPPRFLQRIVAVRKPGTSPAQPPRFLLNATE
jgi:SAM-dependent methyltransferase